MNVIEFRVIPTETATKTAPGIAILIDGTPLQALARAVELPFATTEDAPDLAGDYANLTDPEIFWPSHHFLDDPRLTWPNDPPTTVLLGCPCGDWGCWPLSTDVHLTPETVTWSNFRNSHRPHWNLAPLGPFTFARAQYETALHQTGPA